MRIRWLLLCFLITSLLAGCGNRQLIRVEEPKAIGSGGSSAIVVIDDRRPPEDRESSFGAMLITSDQYGIWTLGDDSFARQPVEILRTRLLHAVAKSARQPQTITVTLNRMVFKANHQATMLKETASQLRPLGVMIAEVLAGKDFEFDVDQSRPFLLGVIEADVQIDSGGRKTSRSLSLAKAENFSSHMDVAGRNRAAAEVVNQLLAGFSAAAIE